MRRVIIAAIAASVLVAGCSGGARDSADDDSADDDSASSFAARGDAVSTGDHSQRGPIRWHDEVQQAGRED